MKKYSNKFVPGAAHHVYQITADKGILFYSENDMLVMYSIISVLSRRFGIRVYSICFMLNHVHLLVEGFRKKEFQTFIKRYSSDMAQRYNANYKRAGTLFSPAGYAPKKGPKEFRTCNNYILNNAPEKQICKNAVDFRWNFLAYFYSDNPFSQAYVESRSSGDMKRYVAILKDYRKRERYLNYEFLDVIRQNLSPVEWQQIIDIIVKEYWFLDYEKTVSYYDGMDNMLHAASCNLGAEHDLYEETGSRSFMPYYRMIKVAKKRNVGKWNPYLLSEKEKKEYADWFFRMGYGSPYQIKRLLHISDNQ